MKLDLSTVSSVDGLGGDHGSPFNQAPHANVMDVRLFQAVFHEQAQSSMLSQPVEHYAQSMGSNFEAWRNDWMALGSKIDLTDQRSAVHMLEQQAKLSSQTVQFQFALQSADNVRHAFKSLTQQQA